MKKKVNYFYIDETGGINNNSELYVYGCLKTDSPLKILSVLENLIMDISQDLYDRENLKKIKENGFHATDDHFDIRAHYYRILPLLNVRAYFVALYKESDYFKKLKEEKEDHEIIQLMLKRLIIPRITKNKDCKNIFIVETLKVQGKPLQEILNEIIRPFEKKFDVEFSIEGKENVNLSTVDYFLFNLKEVLSRKKLDDRSAKTFDILKDRIALINILNDNKFYSRKGKEQEEIKINNLRKI